MRWVWGFGGRVGWGGRRGGRGVAGELEGFGALGVWGFGYSQAGVG